MCEITQLVGYECVIIRLPVLATATPTPNPQDNTTQPTTQTHTQPTRTHAHHQPQPWHINTRAVKQATQRTNERRRTTQTNVWPTNQPTTHTHTKKGNGVQCQPVRRHSRVTVCACPLFKVADVSEKPTESTTAHLSRTQLGGLDRTGLDWTGMEELDSL